MAAVPTRISPRQPAELPEVLQFMQTLWAVVHGLETTSKRMGGTIGVTGPQRLVLRVVGLFPGLCPGDVAAILHLHPSTLTGILRRLTEGRLLARVPDAHDRRRAVLRLTAAGSRANRVKRGTVELAVARALAGVRASDGRAARRVLARLADQLEGGDGRLRAAPPSRRERRPGRTRAGRP